VRRTINELLRLGWLTKEQSRVHHGGEWAANIYTLNPKPRYQRKKLRRHRRSNLTARADQGKHTETAGRNRRSNLTDRTRENEFQAKSNASRLGGAPRSPRQTEPNGEPMPLEELEELRSHYPPDWYVHKTIAVMVEEQDWDQLRVMLSNARYSKAAG
jgi:hypothetical protein